MRLVPINDLPEDARLARDILTGRDAAPLLRAGVTLSARFIDHLTRAGIRAVWVEDRYSQGIDPEPAISAQTRAAATRALVALHDEAKRAAFAGRPLDPEATEGLAMPSTRFSRRLRSRTVRRSCSPTYAAPTHTRSSTRSM